MPEKKPFHVSGLEPTKMKVLGVNIFPLITKMTGLLSDETRRKQMTKKVELTISISTKSERDRESQRESERVIERVKESQREP